MRTRHLMRSHGKDGANGGNDTFSALLTTMRRGAGRRAEDGIRQADARRHVALVATQEAVAAAGLDFDAVMQAVVQGAIQVAPQAEGAVIEMREGDRLVYRAASGTSAAHVGLVLRLSGSLSGRAITEGLPLFSSDTETDERVDRAACRRVGVRAMVVVPIPHRGSFVGVLKLHASAPHRIGASDVPLAQLLVGTLSVGISGIAEAEASGALQVSQTRLRLATEAAAIGTWDFDLTSGQLLWDARCKALFGLPPDTPDSRVHYETFLAGLHPDDRDASHQVAQTALDPAGSGQYDIEYRTIGLKDGIERWVAAKGRAFFEGEGEARRAVRFTGIVRDISERKRTEAALRAGEERLRDLVTTLDLGSLMTRDMKGAIQFWSKGCERLYGWSAEQAVSQQAHDLLQTVFPVPRSEIEAALLRDGEWTGDLRQHRRDGTEIITSARKVLRRGAAGQPIAVVESVADVTALRRTRMELERLNQDLEGRVQEEIAARQAAQARAVHAERVQALGQLAGGIAHDFNNVLQAVGGANTLIGQAADDPPRVRDLVGKIGSAVERGSSTTRRLLALSRRDHLRAEPIEVGPLLEGMREVLAHTLDAGISVRTAVEAGLSPLLADRGQLETVLVNLATNARDAMPDGGTLTLSARSEHRADPERHPADLQAGRYVRLSVLDTGVGMTPATLAHVLEPFFTTKPIGKGTGLGLAMAKGFAEQSGGGLHIDSALGRGTTVTLWLPQVEPDPKMRAPTVRSAATGTASSRQVRLLLVDDDELVRETLTAQMEEAGCSVAAVASGAEALERLAADKAPDVLITDLSMPGMDGLALIRAAQGCRPGLPAVLLTGYAGDSAALAARAEGNGPVRLLRKPVRAALLLDQVLALGRAAPDR